MRPAIFFLISLFFFSCSTRNAGITKNKYLQLNELWIKRASKIEFINSLGDQFQEIKSGIIYNYPNSTHPEIGIFLTQMAK